MPKPEQLAKPWNQLQGLLLPQHGKLLLNLTHLQVGTTDSELLMKLNGISGSKTTANLLPRDC